MMISYRKERDIGTVEAMRRPVILIIDSEEPERASLDAVLRDCYETVLAKEVFEALEAIKSGSIDLVLMDMDHAGVDGIEALELIKKADSDIGVVMLSSAGSAEQAVRALKKGAYDYITRPFDGKELLSAIKRFTDTLNLRSEVRYLKEELSTRTSGEMLSVSPRMRRVFEIIAMVSSTPTSVLITGESGTGKELVARAIHSFGERKGKPFVAFNCGAVPSELMESELFGHERGAFTGAHARKIGKFEYADGGTVFLDEVSTLPMHLQIKLLRVLQEKSFERVGANVPIKVDIRVIAASNVDLEKEVRKGAFRDDLYYRLKVVPIELPPLRERQEDIALLARHFLDKHSKKCGKRVIGISEGAIKALIGYKWPGNVRELENLMERLVVLSRDGFEIGIDDLPSGIFEAVPDETREGRDFKEALRMFERRYIIGVLTRTNWNRGEAARLMKIHRNTLFMKMKELKIREPRG
ncbi:MAG: sigma-54-dependent Fis family transcriptional regulator [Deltaproteobacteria bacterium]|nr:sigma-54-dependent Fis family transcriptional regulator [Deltaproteobacteria bacterium]